MAFSSALTFARVTPALRGHALAALLVGGSVEAVVLESVHAGHCLSRIPDGFLPRLVVFSAGYLGNAVAAA